MSEDRTIADAVSMIKIYYPSMEIGLALAIGEAILAERQRCADVAQKASLESFASPQHRARMQAWRDCASSAILSGES